MEEEGAPVGTPEGWAAVWRQIDGLRQSVNRHKRRATLANQRADAAEARVHELESKLARIRIHAVSITHQMDSLERSAKLLLGRVEE